MTNRNRVDVVSGKWNATIVDSLSAISAPLRSTRRPSFSYMMWKSRNGVLPGLTGDDNSRVDRRWFVEDEVRPMAVVNVADSDRSYRLGQISHR